MKKLCTFLFLVFFVFIALPAPKASIAQVDDENPVQGQIWANYPLLKHITSCESWGDPNKEPREFTPDGKVLRGYPNPQDIGVGQINLPTWGPTAEKLGFDLFTYEGNVGFSKWLYDHYGWKPWVYSKGCWGPYL